MHLELLLLIPGTLTILLIHELGHLLAARWCGVAVLHIAIGLGPHVLSRIDRRGTKWTLALLPLGGLCSIGSAKVDPANPRARTEAQFCQEAFIYVSGPALNLVVAASIYLVTIYHVDQVAFLDANVLTTSAAIPMIIAWLSFGVGIFNLLPIPPLDGGQLLLIGMQACSGKHYPERLQQRLAAIGLAVVGLASFFSSVILFMRS